MVHSHPQFIARLRMRLPLCNGSRMARVVYTFFAIAIAIIFFPYRNNHTRTVNRNRLINFRCE